MSKVRRIQGQVKFKLRNFDIAIYTEGHIQEVRYIYSVEDLPGLLVMYLIMAEEADPVEQFVIHIKDLYKGYNKYVIYHGKWKYSLLKNKVQDNEYKITRFKMW